MGEIHITCECGEVYDATKPPNFTMEENAATAECKACGTTLIRIE